MKLESSIRIRPDFLYLAPLLNVVGLLLLFFLLTSGLVVKSGVRVTLPVGNSSYKANEANHVITITAGDAPSIYLNQSPVALGDLRAQLEALRREARFVLINADALAPVGLVDQVTEAVLAAGCEAARGMRLPSE
jgi:biopolymer transport protein ExbD